ncbi:DUF6518 family protein [Baekduia sp. Peel2402]|uniref:DUF6518 family protein n=1 Tax=Baekduia sp. Peel2402 TaxID=3458296 RepID=UPI00403EAC1E
MPTSLLAVLGGALVGVATLISETHFGEIPNAFLDSIAVWLIASFVVGAAARTRTHAMTVGLIACLAEVAGYYVAAAARGVPGSPHEIAYWTACAFPGGLTFGLAGRFYREGGGLKGVLGAIALPVAFAVEGLYTYAYVEHRDQAGAAWVLIALLLAYAFFVALPPFTTRNAPRMNGWTRQK